MPYFITTKTRVNYNKYITDNKTKRNTGKTAVEIYATQSVSDKPWHCRLLCHCCWIKFKHRSNVVSVGDGDQTADWSVQTATEFSSHGIRHCIFIHLTHRNGLPTTIGTHTPITLQKTT